jgi:hypothetical protein
MPITENLKILVFCRTLQKKLNVWVRKRKKTPIKTQAATQHVPYNTKGKQLTFILMYVDR